MTIWLHIVPLTWLFAIIFGGFHVFNLNDYTGDFLIKKVDGITGADLIGAVFDIYDGDSHVKTVTLGGDGTIDWSTINPQGSGYWLITGLEQGKEYSIKEVIPPNGYLLNETEDENPKTVCISSSQTPDTIPKVIFVNYKPETSPNTSRLKLIKTDTSGKPLNGATFEIYTKSEPKALLAVADMSNTSEWISDWLPRGEYTVIETIAPEGTSDIIPKHIGDVELKGKAEEMTVLIITNTLVKPEEPKPSEQPSASEEPIPSEQPSESEEPQPSEQPSESEEPKPSEQPSELEESKPSEQPSESEEAKPSESPLGTDKPKASDHPSEPPKTKLPSKPKATDKPDSLTIITPSTPTPLPIIETHTTPIPEATKPPNFIPIENVSVKSNPTEDAGNNTSQPENLAEDRVNPRTGDETYYVINWGLILASAILLPVLLVLRMRMRTKRK